MSGNGNLTEYRNERISHLVRPVVTAEDTDGCGLLDPYGACLNGEKLTVFNYILWTVPVSGEDPTGCGMGGYGDDIEVLEEFVQQL
jgi:hypothetical protein